MTLNIIPFFSPIANENWTSRILENLEGHGASIISPDEFLEKINKDSELIDQHIYIFVGTGGTENLVADFIEKVQLKPPITLLSYERANSLPAAIEIRTYLQQKGIPSQIVHNHLDQLINIIHEWSDFSRLAERLESARLGIIGKPSHWLIASHVDRKAVKERWGLTIEDIQMDELLGNVEYEQISKSEIEEFRDKAQRTAIDDEELEKAGKVAKALQKILKKHHLDAVTVECFKLLEETNISGCYALSHLNNVGGITAGCEGDIPTTFTMLVAELLTGQPAFMANIIDIDQDANSVVFAHCTVPTRILEEYEITTHFETSKSVAIRGKFAFQDVTILKLHGEDLSTCWISTGRIIENLSNEMGCRTQIRVSLTEPVDYFLNSSLANHHVIIPGDHSERIDDFLSFVLRK